MAGTSQDRWGTRRARPAGAAPASNEPPAPERRIVHREPPPATDAGSPTPRVSPGYARPPGRGETELARASERRPATADSPEVTPRPAREAQPFALEPAQAPGQPPRAGQRPPAGPGHPLAQPKILVPALVVVLVLGIAMGFTPGGGGRGPTLAEQYADATATPATATEAPMTNTPGAASATVVPTQAGSNPSPVPANLTVSALATRNAGITGTPEGIAHPEDDREASSGDLTISSGDSTAASASPVLASNEVAGVQASPTPEPTPDYSPAQCGEIQEMATQVSVEQTLSGVSVKATQAAVYPIAYLRCILMATGSRDSMAIAGSLDRAERGGATHGAVIDLWITNSQRDFAQLNLKTAMIAAVGQTFSPLATLNGRSEIVVSGGQGRNIALVVALTQTLDATVGPMTVQIDAPMLGGKAIAGKYQLFLPTP